MRVQEFEGAVARVSDFRGLWEVFTAFYRNTEVACIAYHHLPPLGAPDADQVSVSAFGIPEALVDRYVREKFYLDNPRLNHAQHTTAPFYFDEVDDSAPLTDRARLFLEAARKVGLGEGMGLEVFGPNGRNGYCGLGFEHGVRRLPEARVYDFQWACQLAHLRFCDILEPMLGPKPRLSRREAEVLGWVARGKSNPEIATILGISTHTVDAHLRRIYLKLGVFDRISAAVRGLGVGLIDCAV